MRSAIECSLADDGAAVVTVLGEIDFTNADEVAHGIEEVVSCWSPSAVRIDLRSATFIDSTGLGALIAGYRTAVEHRTDFVVVNPSAGFRRVLAVTGLCELFSVDREVCSGPGAEGIAI